jgi:hypothetical protein
MRPVRMLLCCVLLALTIVMPANAQEARLCFDVPGIVDCIEGSFLFYWKQNGGLAVFGYPISPARMERNEDTNRYHETQWFERARFEWHFENPSPYGVALGRLGAYRLDLLGRDPEGLFADATPDPGCAMFSVGSQQQAVCGQFLTFWQQHGLNLDGRPGVTFAESMALFGLPLSGARMEANPNGDWVLTQWFERARLELHPYLPPGSQVLVGLLGRETAPTAIEPPLPHDWLERFNAIRAAAGLAPVVEDPQFSYDAGLHVNYMLLNPGNFRHAEDPARPGYSQAGHEAAAQSNLTQGHPVGTSASAMIDGWMESAGHRYGMLRPELKRTGFALGCNDRTCAGALNILGGLQRERPNSVSVVYPGDGQKDVRTELITWQFHPHAPTVQFVRAELRDHRGRPVPVHVLSPEECGNGVGLVAPLRRNITYTVEIEVMQNGQPLRRQWSFTTLDAHEGCVCIG